MFFERDIKKLIHTCSKTQSTFKRIDIRKTVGINQQI